MVAANPETVLVLVSSYPYAIDWAAEHVPAILWTSHAGQELGNGVAAVLSGRHNPSGRLPQTWYAADTELPAREDYDVIGSRWTYRYSRREHTYPFGHGLSYTAFEYGDPVATVLKQELGALTLTVSLSVANIGGADGHEVVQLYVRRGMEELPILVGFERVFLAAGETKAVAFEVQREQIERWSEADGRYFLPEGEYEFEVGRSSADLPVSTRVELS